MDIFKISERNQQAALKVLQDTQVIPAWESIGAEVHIVGSVKSGLIMKSKDIDLHIYTENLSVSDSFAVVSQLSEKLPFKEVLYRNLIDTEEECMEWHAFYDDTDGNTWKFDMIHIRKGSKYDGVVEKVTDDIIRKLTPETRNAILQIKFDLPEDKVAPGIMIYYAVFTEGVRSYQEFEQWYKHAPAIDSLEWRP